MSNGTEVSISPILSLCMLLRYFYLRFVNKLETSTSDIIVIKAVVTCQNHILKENRENLEYAAHCTGFDVLSVLSHPKASVWSDKNVFRAEGNYLFIDLDTNLELSVGKKDGENLQIIHFRNYENITEDFLNERLFEIIIKELEER
ncbi:hypothetical protein EIN_279860 [Entamoeba invadens IP1]|uniref:Uncharacterized protein n=1 Tax=Entamoeba invadens IP1 TaxID=370355 RepID=A0A0A1U7T6_ENTIV|nr:hypothetical protein EIN_279860 [Entamoeba invadens IP1]ELP90989.1 hypothetical protein EIN_279860 [Entamoeba invadens IP1]|eukprot:XP_004257760.1 hypothetical protein EIN_279860 [Entamoeba invadens IP1]